MTSTGILIVEASSSPNIALIKYWGKAFIKNNIPLNDSISITLDRDTLKTETVCYFDPSCSADTVVLDDENHEISARMKLMVDFVRNVARDTPSHAKYACVESMSMVPHRDAVVSPDVRFRLVSHNSFPSAAGMASSASGMCAAAACLCAGYLPFNFDQKFVSCVARIGSGSACRSAYGGYVYWNSSTEDSATSSFAQQVPIHDDYKNVIVLMVVLSADRKQVSSSDGMKRSVATSSLMKSRIENVPSKIINLRDILQHPMSSSWPEFCRCVMKDSNNFHAICLDSYPPIRYLNDDSHRVMTLVHAYNTVAGDDIVAYSFDAGPNPFIFLPNVKHALNFVNMLQQRAPCARELCQRLTEAWRSADCADVGVPVPDIDVEMRDVVLEYSIQSVTNVMMSRVSVDGVNFKIRQ